MVREIRLVEIALGDGRKRPQTSKWDTRLAARQQLIALSDIHLGETFTPENLGTRPRLPRESGW
jgi:sialic acid synthase SpsE